MENLQPATDAKRCCLGPLPVLAGWPGCEQQPALSMHTRLFVMSLCDSSSAQSQTRRCPSRRPKPLTHQLLAPTSASKQARGRRRRRPTSLGRPTSGLLTARPRTSPPPQRHGVATGRTCPRSSGRSFRRAHDPPAAAARSPSMPTVRSRSCGTWARLIILRPPEIDLGSQDNRFDAHYNLYSTAVRWRK